MLRTAAIAIVLAANLALSPATSAQQPDPTELTFWNSVKDSKSPDEFKAYLTKYPTGAFAELAKLRVKALETPAARPAPPAAAAAPATQATPPAPSPSASVLSDTSTIRDIHIRLYNLNYQVGAATGTFTPQLREAIKSWQTNLKRTPNGVMTASDYATLKAAVPATTWGAIAYAAAGAYGSQWNHPTRAAAESAAMAACRRNAGSSPCEVRAAARTGCLAISHYQATIGSKKYSGTYLAGRSTLAEATASAQVDCQSKAQTPAACAIRSSLCADGSHKK